MYTTPKLVPGHDGALFKNPRSSHSRLTNILNVRYNFWFDKYNVIKRNFNRTLLTRSQQHNEIPILFRYAMYILVIFHLWYLEGSP